MRIIVCLSGGLSSFFVADWAFKNYSKENIILYFNDTKWEHKDLYRFLDDIKKYFSHDIYIDSDGRSPEDLFYDNRALANNRMPFCSRILKADRLQKFVKDGDILLFGIGCEEYHRSIRINDVYSDLAKKNNINLSIRFPIIENKVFSYQIKEWFKKTGLKTPELYLLGFSHNNCSGGCVRAGKGQWIQLLKILPDVYAERERIEIEFSEFIGKKITFLKDISLKELRELNSTSQLSFLDDELIKTECIGVCSNIA